jgi:hypothetical protein
MAWDQFGGSFYYLGPGSERVIKCGCHGYHQALPHFMIIDKLDQSSAWVRHADQPDVKFKIYQPYIILNIGQKPHTDPTQTFDMLTNSQKKFIVRTLSAGNGEVG